MSLFRCNCFAFDLLLVVVFVDLVFSQLTSKKKEITFICFRADMRRRALCFPDTASTGS